MRTASSAPTASTSASTIAASRRSAMKPTIPSSEKITEYSPNSSTVSWRTMMIVPTHAMRRDRVAADHQHARPERSEPDGAACPASPAPVTWRGGVVGGLRQPPRQLEAVGVPEVMIARIGKWTSPTSRPGFITSMTSFSPRWS